MEVNLTGMDGGKKQVYKIWTELHSVITERISQELARFGCACHLKGQEPCDSVKS